MSKVQLKPSLVPALKRASVNSILHHRAGWVAISGRVGHQITHAKNTVMYGVRLLAIRRSDPRPDRIQQCMPIGPMIDWTSTVAEIADEFDDRHTGIDPRRGGDRPNGA